MKVRSKEDIENYGDDVQERERQLLQPLNELNLVEYISNSIEILMRL